VGDWAAAEQTVKQRSDIPDAVPPKSRDPISTSGAAFPPSGEAKTREHPGSRQSTNQQRDYGRVEVCNGDRSGDRKAHYPTYKPTSTVARQDPAESARDSDCDTDDAAEHRAA